MEVSPTTKTKLLLRIILIPQKRHQEVLIHLYWNLKSLIFLTFLFLLIEKFYKANHKTKLIFIYFKSKFIFKINRFSLI